jgi:AraC-like DNA-binding protein
LTPPTSYVERPPVPALADLVRVVWIQRIGAEPYIQRNLPTGGAEMHCRIGAVPRLVGPLTGPSVEILAPGTVLVGARFHPGMAATILPLPTVELLDQDLASDDVWGCGAIRLGDALNAAASPEAALAVLQRWLVHRRTTSDRSDPLVSEAVRLLMPWRAGDVGALSRRLAISASQLRRRCLNTIGTGPKTLQRTLRFQGFLALAQSAGTAGGTPAAGDGLAAFAADLGYADHAHLTRECLRLSGLPPSAFLADLVGRCGCGHDHAASYVPILRGRLSAVDGSAGRRQTRRGSAPAATLVRSDPGPL